MSQRVCRVCFKDFRIRSLVSLLDPDSPLCDQCLKELKRSLHRRDMGDFNVWCLGYYEGRMKELLLTYKELGDYELYRVFLYPFGNLITLFFTGYTLVCAPSSQEALEKRGFNHMEAIASTLHLNRISPFIKSSGLDQKDLTREERLQVLERIKIGTADEIKGRKILLFDDVISTGATIRACRKLLLERGARRVSALALMDNNMNKKITKQP